MMISFPPSPPSSDDTSSIPLSFFSAFPDATTTVSTSAVDVDAATGDDLNATTAILPSLLSMNTPLSSNDNASIVRPSQILNDLSSHVVIQHDDQNNNDASIEKNNNDENDDQDENKKKKTKTPVKTKQSRTRKAAKTKSAVITRAQKQQDVDSSSVNGDDADENGTNHHRRRSTANKKKSNEDGSSSSSSSSDNDEDNYNDEHDDDDEHDDNENDNEHDNEDDDNEENRLCVVCDQPRLQFNKVCYIGLKNVEQYKQCFPKYGGEFGRACQSCYNKFYVWKNQQKHGHKKCTCCSRELGKQSCSFKGYADIYREMFPDVDGTDDSRVCQSCYSKALKRKKDQSMADKKKNKKKRRNSSSGSDDGSSTPRTKQNLSDTPPSRRRRGSSKAKSDGDTPTKKQKVHDQKSSQAETTMDQDDTDRKEITLTILVRLYDSSLQHEIKPPNATLSKSFQCSVEPTLLLKEILAVTYNFLGMDTDILKVTNTQPIKNVQLSSLLFKDKESGKHILCAINQKDDAQFQRFPLPDKSQISVDVYYEPAKEDH